MTSQKPKLYDIGQVKVAIELAVNKANKQARADERAKTLKEKNNWLWIGHAGHLCVSNSCRFHLNTFVGEFIVSTVGEYYPANEKEMQTIGVGNKSFYETMVFEARKSKEVCCPFEAYGEELECIRYSTAGQAQKGHLKLCKKWAELKKLEGKHGNKV